MRHPKRRGVKLGRIFGIEISAHATWPIVFALIAIALSTAGPFGMLHVSDAERIALAIFTTVLFFVSLLLHELAHSLLARSRGVTVRGITLTLIGGVSQFDTDAQNAPTSAWISAIGPLTSFLLSAIFFGLAQLVAKTPFGIVFGFLAYANLILAVFNFVPAYPLDGGRVLLALVWRATGDKYRATRVAVVVGRFFSWALMGLGVLQVFGGSVIGGLWTLMIGWFLLQTGTAEGLQAEVKQVLGGHTVGELATQGNPIGADVTAESALQTMLRTSSRALPVMFGEKLVGIVSLDDIGKVAPEELSKTYVTAIMTRESDLSPVSPDTPATEALQLLARSGHDQLPVIAPSGELVGFITQESILRWVAAHRDLSARRVGLFPRS
jgi:Zn-dependent protease/CBS domain-containing protein